MAEKKSLHPNCSLDGCKGPFTCESCGFDHREAARRRRLPFFLFSDGLIRMIVTGSSPGEDPKTDRKAPGLMPWSDQRCFDKAPGRAGRGLYENTSNICTL